MYDQFGLYVGPGYVGGGGDTIQSISLANGGDGSGGWDDPGVSNQYAGNQQDLSAIRQLMGTQGAGYLVTGNASLSNGGDSTAYLPQMMQKAGVNPTQGILNSYQGVTGQAYQPGSQTAYNPQSGGYDISGVTNAVGALGSGISNLGNQFGSVTSQLGQLGGQFDQFGNRINAGLGSITEQLGQVGNQFNNGFSNIGSQLDQFGNRVSGLGAQFDAGLYNMGNQFNSGLSSISSQLGQFGNNFSNLGNQFNSGLSTIGSQFDNGLSNVGSQLNTGLSNMGSQLNAGINNVGSQIGNLGSQLGSQFSAGFDQFGSQISNQLSSGLGSLGNQFNQGFSRFGEQLGGQFGSLNDSLTSLAQQMNKPDEGLQSLNQNFGSFLDMYKKQFERAPYQPKAYEKSPYVDQMVQATTNQVNDNWKRQVQPTIASQAQSVGGYGGSRQGVVEANALNDINRNLASTTANIYQTDYENQQNRNLQEYAANNSLALGMGNLALNTANASNQNQLNLGQLGLGIQGANNSLGLGLGNLALGAQNSNNSLGLGLGNLALGSQNANQNYALGVGNLGLNSQNSQNNFYTAQRGQDLQQYGLGAQLVNQANQGFLNQGSGIYDAGSIYQQAPWGTIGNFNAATTPYTGYGATTTQSQSSNPWAQALGGAIAGGQLGRLF